MIWLKTINVFFFQWLFIRLAKVQEKRIEDYRIISYDLMPDGNMSSRGIGKTITYQHYQFIYWISPLSGWWDDFIYLGKKRYIKLTKEKVIC